jgi:hypothetical protein
LADGSAEAIRTIAGQKTLIGPVRDEIYAYHNHLDAIAVYKGDADGDVAPIRMIRGPKTGLSFTNGRLALDPVHHEVFVPVNTNSVLVFPALAEGDIAPIRVLKGPDTRLGAEAITIDAVHNLLIVSGTSHGWGRKASTPDLTMFGPRGARGSLDGGSVGQIAIFDRMASGNTKPLRVITGVKTMLSSTQTLMTTYPPRGWILGAVWGSAYGETGAPRSDLSMVGVWHITDNGDVAPRWTIGGPNGLLQQARSVTIDPKHKTVFVSDKYHNGVFAFEFPEIF